MHRKWIFGLAGLLVVALIVGGVIFFAPPLDGIYGRYVNQDNPEEYLEIRRDGTFYLYEMGIGVTGKWEVEGDEIRLKVWGLVVRGRIEGNKIIDPDGTIWVRR